MSLTVYVLAEMIPNEELQKKRVLSALMDGDWFTSAIGAGATMDQANHQIIEHLPDRWYWQGLFTLYGVFKFELAGLVTNYED